MSQCPMCTGWGSIDGVMTVGVWVNPQAAPQQVREALADQGFKVEHVGLRKALAALHGEERAQYANALRLILGDAAALLALSLDCKQLALVEHIRDVAAGALEFNQ